jgi:hypothetical protein
VADSISLVPRGDRGPYGDVPNDPVVVKRISVLAPASVQPAPAASQKP